VSFQSRLAIYAVMKFPNKDTIYPYQTMFSIAVFYRWVSHKMKCTDVDEYAYSFIGRFLLVARMWILVESRLLLKDLEKTEYAVVNNLEVTRTDNDNTLSRVSIV
jgi:hypothetical protein